MPLLIPVIILVLVGWLVKYKKWTWLIAGYNTSSQKQKERYDQEKLARVVGNLIFLLAGIFFLMALGISLFPDAVSLITNIGLGVFIATALSGVVYLNTGRRVLKD